MAIGYLNDFDEVHVYDLLHTARDFAGMERRTKSMGLDGETLPLWDFNLGTDDTTLQRDHPEYEVSPAVTKWV